MSLASAESERDIVAILKNNQLWSSEHWRDYGDNENNFAVIGNQQSAPDAALVEKFINSVDAVLMKKCMLHGVDPTSTTAPTNVKQALASFFNIPQGKLSNLSDSQRTSLAQNIHFVATGTKRKPNYSIVDLGEGQTPASLPDTILSLNKSNKLRIPFVQGKFNMGGSGVLQFCGKQNLQLIITKRHPDLPKDKTDHLWAVTLVRRESPTKGRRSSVYTYLAPRNHILSFEAEDLPLLPAKNQALADAMTYGTFIKLFEYNIPGFATLVSLDLYYRLNTLIPTIALPIRIHETREYGGHYKETTLSGLNVRLEEASSKTLEEGFPLSSTLHIYGQKLLLSIIAFKEKQHSNYKKQEGVLFTINGQTHGSLSKNFFGWQSVGMGSLVDSLLLLVDCSNLDARLREDLFMNSRDRLRDGELSRKIKEELARLVKVHPALKELREQRRREASKELASNEELLIQMLTDVFQKSPILSELLIKGTRLPDPFRLKKEREKPRFQGKKHPTFFQLKKPPKNQIHLKHAPLGTRPRIVFETDVENTYFHRDIFPGKATLLLEGQPVYEYSLNLHNGIATLNLELPTYASINETYTYALEIGDDTLVKPFLASFQITIEKEKPKQPPNEKGRRKKGGKQEENDFSKMPAKLALPNIRRVERKDWDKHNFTKYSALRVENNGDSGYYFFLNIDNIYFQTELKWSKPETIKHMKIKYEYGMVMIGLGIVKGAEGKSEEENISLQVEEITQWIAPILLPMLEHLGHLEGKWVIDTLQEEG